MKNQETFFQAINEKKLISIKFNSKEKGPIERTCIPFDFAPSSRARIKEYKYQVYDLNSPSGQHNLAIHPNQIISIQFMDEIFDPKDYVTWSSPYNWLVERSWGIYS